MDSVAGDTRVDAGWSAPACGEGGAAAAATGIEDLPADVLSLVLRRLDGASLAAVGCASAGLRGLAADPDAWRGLCLAMWPSLRALPRYSSSAAADYSPHRALFADAFPFPAPPPSPSTTSSALPARLVSAVDLRHGGELVLSRAVETDASSAWFQGAPFRVDALVQESFTACPAAAPLAAPDLTLTWVLIDPASGRALRASSGRAVAVDRAWVTGDTVARFAVVLGGGAQPPLALAAAVACDERRGWVREVSLRVEDADGAGVSGRDGLRAVAEAMAAGARRGGRGAEREARARYEEFVRGRRARKEWKARREGCVDLCCSGVGAAAFLAFLVMLALR
ncbi:hypothetical protein U9M48_005165 [Paspalum notatum var. saurae]|uniref:F-box domain-containing protein n=1 Tax=Paspalum notatum var. saurae TaxID=547442 RepID=A0AAQ3PLR6_PASNO